MLNSAIMLIFVVICIFQPWMAVIFVLFWLMDQKTKQEQQEKQVAEDYPDMGDRKKLIAKLEKIWADVTPEDLEPDPVHKRDRSHLRVVK